MHTVLLGDQPAADSSAQSVPILPATAPITSLALLSATTSGLALIDKPSGPTSHDVVNWVRRRTGVKRVGHAGTLDPLASGLLIVLIGREWTKHQAHFLHLDKVYECEIRLGVETDTYDRLGQTTQVSSRDNLTSITADQVAAAMQNLTGNINQTVPLYSAIKKQGQPLYKLARLGQADQVVLPSRSVTVFEWQLADFSIQPSDFVIGPIESSDQKSFTNQSFITLKSTIHCSSGTYVRSLVHDLGQALGCGATVWELRRTKIGDHSVASALQIEV